MGMGRVKTHEIEYKVISNRNNRTKLSKFRDQNNSIGPPKFKEDKKEKKN